MNKQVGFTLGGAACVIAFLALGLHDFMLTRLKILYPDASAVPTWCKYLDISVRLGALVVFARAANPTIRRTTTMRAAAIIAFSFMFLNETLRVFCIYVSLTKGWQDHRWYFTLLDRLPTALTWLLYGAVATTIARYFPRKSNVVVVAAVLTCVAVGMFSVQPDLERLAASSEHTFHLQEPQQIYFSPYPSQVYVIIYSTFLEPTLASLALVALIWSGLKGSILYRLGRFVTLLLLVRGRVIALLLFSFWLPEPRGLSFLSESQFLLETLLLGALWGVVWIYVERRRFAEPALA